MSFKLSSNQQLGSESHDATAILLEKHLDKIHKETIIGRTIIGQITNTGYEGKIKLYGHVRVPPCNEQMQINKRTEIPILFKKTNSGFIESNKDKGVNKTYTEIEKAFFDSIIKNNSIEKIKPTGNSHLRNGICNVVDCLLRDHSTRNNGPWLIVPQTLEEQLKEIMVKTPDDLEYFEVTNSSNSPLQLISSWRRMSRDFNIYSNHSLPLLNSKIIFGCKDAINFVSDFTYDECPINTAEYFGDYRIGLIYGYEIFAPLLGYIEITQ